MSMLRARPNLPMRLFDAVRRDEPVVDANTHHLVGAEALLRWYHPTEGILTASVFAHAAEQTGVLSALGRQVLLDACSAAAHWPLPDGFTIRVNVNAQQLGSRTFLADVRAALRAAQLDASRLSLEITETMQLTTNRRLVANLHAVRDLGVGVELDDFGTGYASPLFLKQLPVTGIKLDRAFVMGIGLSNEDESILSHLTSLAIDFGLTVCGEGVEHREQGDYLASIGADSMQGYLFGRALPADELHHLMATFTQRAIPFTVSSLTAT
jgi:EAL domain-containing protein (putative c-di-GMP-specific phosphodiesterase class I)